MQSGPGQTPGRFVCVLSVRAGCAPAYAPSTSPSSSSTRLRFSYTKKNTEP